MKAGTHFERGSIVQNARSAVVEMSGTCYTQMAVKMAHQSNAIQIYIALVVFVPAETRPRHARPQWYLAPDYLR